MLLSEEEMGSGVSAICEELLHLSLIHIYIRLAFKLPFIAQDLKSREQGKGAVLRKGGDVGTAVAKSVLLGKGIIKSV